MAWVLGYGPRTAPEPAAEVPVWRSASLIFPLDGPASLAVDGLPGALADGLTELATDLFLYRGGVLVYRGRVVDGLDTLTDVADEVSVASVDYRGLLARRLCRTELTYTQVPQADIAWALVAHAQAAPGGDLGITREAAPPAGRERDRVYDAGQSIGEALDNLSNVEDGFDYDVTPGRVLRVHYPRREAPLPVPLVVGQTVARLERSRNAAMFANGVRVNGGQGTTGVYGAAASAATDPRGLWETQIGYPSVVVQQTVADRQAFHLAERSTFRPSYRVLLSPDVWARFPLPAPGDVGRVAARSGRVADDVAVRVTEVAVDVGIDRNESVTVAVVADRP